MPQSPENSIEKPNVSVSLTISRSEAILILDSLEHYVTASDELGCPFYEDPNWADVESVVHILISVFPDDSEISFYAHILKGKPRT